jgi:hypothetical protein
LGQVCLSLAGNYPTKGGGQYALRA